MIWYELSLIVSKKSAPTLNCSIAQNYKDRKYRRTWAVQLAARRSVQLAPDCESCPRQCTALTAGLREAPAGYVASRGVSPHPGVMRRRPLATAQSPMNRRSRTGVGIYSRSYFVYCLSAESIYDMRIQSIPYIVIYYLWQTINQSINNLFVEQTVTVLGKNIWGPGPSSFGRQQQISEITIEPCRKKWEGAGQDLAGLCPLAST